MTVNRLSVVRAVAVTFSFALVTGCGSTPIESEPQVPDFTATVISVNPPTTAGVYVLTKDLRPPPDDHEVMVIIDSDTDLVSRRQDGRYEKATASDIVAGAILRVKLTGVCTRSLPPQCPAAWIEVAPPVTE